MMSDSKIYVMLILCISISKKSVFFKFFSIMHRSRSHITPPTPHSDNSSTRRSRHVPLSTAGNKQKAVDKEHHVASKVRITYSSNHNSISQYGEVLNWRSYTNYWSLITWLRPPLLPQSNSQTPKISIPLVYVSHYVSDCGPGLFFPSRTN